MLLLAKGNGIGSYCPWPREEFSYRGLCTHNPLIESPVGDFDLSPEQMEVVAAEVKARRKAYSVDNRVAAVSEIPDHQDLLYEGRVRGLQLLGNENQ